MDPAAAAAAAAALGSRPLDDPEACDLSGKSVDELPGEGFVSLVCWKPWTGEPVGPCPGGVLGDLLSRVVLARPRSVALVGLAGARVDVDRSSVGVDTVGGVGAGR